MARGPKVGDAYIRITADGKSVRRALDKLEADNRKILGKGGNLAGKEWSANFDRVVAQRVRKSFSDLSNATVDGDFSRLIRSHEVVEEGVKRIKRELAGWEKGYVRIGNRLVKLPRDMQSTMRLTREQRLEIEKMLDLFEEQAVIERSRQQIAEGNLRAEKARAQTAKQAAKDALRADRLWRTTAQARARHEKEVLSIGRQVVKQYNDIVKAQQKATEESVRAAERNAKAVERQRNEHDRLASSVRDLGRQVDMMSNKTIAWSRRDRAAVEQLRREWELLTANLNSGKFDNRTIIRQLTEVQHKFRDTAVDIDRHSKVIGSKATWLRRFRTELRSIDRDSGRVTKSINAMRAGIAATAQTIGSKLSQSWKRMDSTVRLVLTLIASAAEHVATLGSAVSSAATAVLSSLVYALGIAIPLAAGLVAGLLGVGLAVQAWKSMSEEMASFQRAVERVKDAWSEQAQAFADAWAPALIPFLDSISRLMEVSNLGKTLGGAFAGITDAFSGVINGPGMQAFLTAVQGPLSAGIESFGQGVASVTDGLLWLFSAAAPGFQVLGDMFSQWGGRFSETMQRMAEDGTIADFVDRAINAWEGLMGVIGPLGKALGNIFNVGEESGGRLLERLGNIMERFEEWTSSLEGKNALAEWFKNGETVMGGLGDLIGGVSEALASLVDAGTVARLTDFLSSLGELAPYLADVLRVVSNVNILGALVDALNAVGAAIQPIMPHFEALSLMLGQALAAAITVLTPLLMSIGEALVPVMNALMPIVTALLPVLVQLIASLVPVLVPVIELVSVVLADALTNLLPIILAIVQGIQTYLIPIIESLVPVLQNVVGFISALINGDWAAAWDSLTKLVESAWDFIVSLLTNASGLIESIIGTMMSAMQQNFAKGWEAIKSFAASFWQWLISVAQNGMTSLRTNVSNALANVRTFFSNAWTNIRTAANNFWNSLISASRTQLNNVVTAVKELPTKIKNGLVSIANTGMQIASDFISGVVNGITSGAIRVRDAAINMARSAWDAVKSFFGIASPSKLMHQAGLWLTQGLAQGLRAGSGQVASEAKRLAKNTFTQYEKESTRRFQQYAKMPNGIRIISGAFKAVAQESGRRLRELQEDIRETQARIKGLSSIKNPSRSQRNALSQAKDDLNELQGKAELATKYLRDLGENANKAAADQVKAVRDRLEDARKSLSDLRKESQKMRESVATSLQSALSLGSVVGEDGKVSQPDLKNYLRTMATKAKNFAGALKKLVAAGLPPALVQEIASLGIENGLAVAEAFLGASKADRKAMVADFTAFNKATDSAGKIVADQMYGAGIDAAAGLVRGLTAEHAKVKKAAETLARNIAGWTRKALGIKSPSRVFAAIGEHIVEGLEQGLMGNDAERAARRLAQSVVNGAVSDDMVQAGIAAAEMFANGFGRGEVAVAPPTITPVTTVGSLPSRSQLAGGGSGGTTIVLEEGAVIVQSRASDPTIVAEQVVDRVIVALDERERDRAY